MRYRVSRTRPPCHTLIHGTKNADIEFNAHAYESFNECIIIKFRETILKCMHAFNSVENLAHTRRLAQKIDGVTHVITLAKYSPFYHFRYFGVALQSDKRFRALDQS